MVLLMQGTRYVHTSYSDHIPYGLVCYEHSKVLLLPCATLVRLYDTELVLNLNHVTLCYV
jgi:hypothetical protein